MLKLLIVADDFTGGLDTGVQFARRGIRTRVVTNPEADYARAADGCEVLVVVAETRHAPAAAAHEAVRRIVQKGVRLGVPHVYKKTDSALRGNIGAELSAALQASGAAMLPFLPALPGLRRTTVKGVHYIDGVPVAESVFGRDPFAPVPESDVLRLLARQTDTPAWSAAPDGDLSGAGICVVDAQSEADFAAAGRRLAAAGSLAVLAGCAGFAALLPDLLGLAAGEPPQLPPLDDGLFVLCGSVNPITRRQLARAERGGFTRLQIDPALKLDERSWADGPGRQALADWRRALENDRWLILDSNDADGDNAATQARAAALGLSAEAVRRRISGALGRILSELVSGPAARTLLITGGDTLLACMDRLGVAQMEPLLELFPGVVLSRFTADGRERLVITKSGGFGEETLLLDLRALIEGAAQG